MKPDAISMLAQANRPAEKAQGIGDIALGASLLIALAAALLGAPRPIKSIAFASSTAIAAIQWRNAASPSRQQALETSQSLQRFYSEALRLQLEAELQTQNAKLKLVSDSEILAQIAQAPRPIQPLLLERLGYGWIIPALTGQAVKSTKPSAPASALPVPLAPPSDSARDDVQEVDLSAGPEPVDLAADLGQYPQSAIIAGVPGAGKGMVVSNALRHLKVHHPDTTIFVIDPKGDPKESGYWEGFGAIVRRCRFLNADPDDCAQWLLERLEEFAAIQGPKLLVFDEGSAAIATLKLASKEIKAMGRLKAFVAHISSMGDSGETWLWMIAQIIHVSDLGMSGGFRGIFRAVALVSPKNRFALQSFLGTDFVPLPAGGMAEINALMEASPVNRAFFDGKTNQWMPSPRLQNWSGYDRDTRKEIPNA